jgi:16S rRNA (cytosine1402-N4)-methyltransferase
MGKGLRAYHVPVLPREMMDIFKPQSGQVFIDATAGGGGHTELLLNQGAQVFAIDTDGDAIRQLQQRFQTRLGNELTLIRGNFRNLKKLVEDAGLTSVDGIIFDLGVSSYQLDNPVRGFTYREADAKLDMRMDDQLEMNAETIVNCSTRGALYEIIAQFGEEKYARTIADSICRARKVKKISLAGQLEKIVFQATGGTDLRSLSRVFQALRIAVNDEINALKEGLDQAHELLKNLGVCIVISYHSLEDRIVKLEFRKKSWETLTPRPLRPQASEVRTNRRARAAKLRAARKNYDL